MAKTSRSHPLSPPPRPRAKVTNRHRSPSARYKAGYASSPPMPDKDAPDLRKRPYTFDKTGMQTIQCTAC